MDKKVRSKQSRAVPTSIKSFLASSGLKKGDMEVRRVESKPDRIYIVYREPNTHDRMRTPDGGVFRRYKLLEPQYDKKGKLIKYRTCKDGGLHLYFPDSLTKGNVRSYLEANPDSPIYFTEGEKKAAKAWKEGIPCIGLSGIWSWVANNQGRPTKEKILNADFDFIPNLASRAVIMIYDSDANDPAKQNDFNNCSNTFERCLRSRGISRYEKIVLPSDGDGKVGLDDYLLEHSVSEFNLLVAKQSKVLPLGPFIMTSPEFLSTKFPPIKSILRPWLTDCGLTMIHAAPGVGKTYFLLGLSAAITRRKLPEDFCGWKIKRGAGVLFVDGEMASTFMQNRLAKVEAAFHNNPASKKRNLSLLSCMNYSRQTGKILNFSDEYHRNEFSKYVINHPAKVIILDNIVSLMSTKDENDAGAWSVINQWLLYLRAMGKSVIIVHHSSKHGTQRGTSHRSDNLDTILKLKSDGDNAITVEFEKHRNFGGDEAAKVHIDFEIDDNKAVFTRAESVDYELEERNSKIYKMSKKGKSQRYIIRKVEKLTGKKLSKSSISQIVKKMKEQEQKVKV